MELKRYLQIMIAKRWIVLLTFVVTFGTVLLLTLTQTPVYESVATYVLKPNLSEPDTKTLWTALDILSRDQMQATLAEVANSRLIKVQAGRALGLTGQQMSGLSVSSRPVAGTNVVQIAVEGPDPALTRDFASAVGTQTANYVQGLYAEFALQLLDEPTSSSSPVKPKTVLNLLLGAAAGLVLSAGLAFLSAYLQTPAEAEMPEPQTASAISSDDPVTPSRGRSPLKRKSQELVGG